MIIAKTILYYSTGIILSGIISSETTFWIGPLQREAKPLARRSNDKQSLIPCKKLSKILWRARKWRSLEHNPTQQKRYKNNLLKQTDCIIRQYMEGDKEMFSLEKSSKMQKIACLRMCCMLVIPQLTTMLRIQLERASCIEMFADR